MPRRADDVDGFVAALDHPLTAGIERLRAAILEADDGISEHVKWNAPSFCYGGVDRVTFRLQPGNRLQLILDRGAKVRDDAADFRFEDPSGLLEWVTADRAVIRFRDTGPVQGHRPELAGVGRTGSFRQLVTSRRAKCRKARNVKIAE
ncbi:DUF1801 domain-containing protein [Blastococcus sp. CT_GayMR20]|uniref:DUF1801 domain-containing protein n=1 Tax=Blastococcus sp. CT_GayMR20 TaxID=2559609 RepID=UPI0010747E3A|nr:DUF1801 domain-containing protein [Blastococcus sp. CT_GayMR20]TFV88644.1 DUF1801 domain-containing protein [Blastococcus sp. CT_GayMR20]TFV88660.1 DUF1801 domain-containing protein [Blastococcus sp. CT_GayMR20]